ncbi:MAG: DUF4145 domain-containing protein [Candidatus Binatia bacterium]
MDVALRRVAVSLPKTQLLVYLRADVRRALDGAAELIPRYHASLTDEARRIVDSDSTRSFEIGLIGRRVVEFVVDDLLSKPKTSPDLAKKIDDLAEIGVAPWIRGYMHTLRILGNESAHEKSSDGRVPPNVSEQDLPVSLFCLQRVIEFWRQYRRASNAL